MHEIVKEVQQKSSKLKTLLTKLTARQLLLKEEISRQGAGETARDDYDLLTETIKELTAADEELVYYRLTYYDEFLYVQSTPDYKEKLQKILDSE